MTLAEARAYLATRPLCHAFREHGERETAEAVAVVAVHATGKPMRLMRLKRRCNVSMWAAARTDARLGPDWVAECTVRPLSSRARRAAIASAQAALF